MGTPNRSVCDDGIFFHLRSLAAGQGQYCSDVFQALSISGSPMASQSPVDGGNALVNPNDLVGDEPTSIRHRPQGFWLDLPIHQPVVL